MKKETTITFIVSECGEFHSMGESVECVLLKDAFKYYHTSTVHHRCSLHWNSHFTMRMILYITMGSIH